MTAIADSDLSFKNKAAPLRPLCFPDLALIAAVYAASFLTVGGAPRPLSGFPLDDAWIHQVISRNLALHGKVGFIPGIWTPGTTSPLWTLLLAPKYLLRIPVNPALYCATLNLLLLIGIGGGLLCLARRDHLPTPLAWSIALGPALDGNFIWISLSGMEHVLFVALSIAGIGLWFEDGNPSSWWAGGCLGALTLTRPEGVILALGLPLFFRKSSGRTQMEAARTLALVVPCIVLLLAFNLKTSHVPLPITYVGRKWLLIGGSSVPLLQTLVFPLMVARSAACVWGPQPGALLTLLTVQFIAIGLWRVCKKTSPRMMVTCLWTLALMGAYALMLPSVTNCLRYQSLLVCLTLPLIAAGLDGATRALRIPPVVSISGIVVIAIAAGAMSLPSWREIYRSGVMLIANTHARAAAFIAEQYPPPNAVASLDIGVLAYSDTRYRVTDLGGLTDPDYLPWLKSGNVLDYIDQRHIAWIVLVSRPDGLSDVPRLLRTRGRFNREFLRLALFCSSSRDYLESGQNHAQCQAVYRRR